MTTTATLNWNVLALWQRLQPVLPGLAIEVVARTDSTNTQLLERARRAGGDPAIQGTTPQGRRQGDAQPCLLVAEQQTRGRGSQGRIWHSAAGASLTFSLAMALSPPSWSGLSLAVGLAIADALDPPSDPSPRIGLKWPNDLLLLDRPGRGRKLGGILIETVAVGQRRMAIIGIGLNVKPLALGDLDWGYACLEERWPELDAPAALAQVVPAVVQAVQRFEAAGLGPFLTGYARRDALAGLEVTTSMAEAAEGVADGIDDEGALWIRTPGGRYRLVSGKVGLRRMPGDGESAETTTC
ncbi:MAG: biotin--[acetyl-CoA-carboxylase] ligase [Aquabacterium sp.]|nr:biotin--[acetyl-CoA-carboxylase] ligase [Aquabacterium sp.]